MTPFSNKCEILSDLWMNYRDDEEFRDFIEYNDLGLPLAYAVAQNIVKGTNLSDTLINETWDLLLAAIEIKEDTGFDNLDSLLGGDLF